MYKKKLLTFLCHKLWKNATLFNKMLLWILRLENVKVQIFIWIDFRQNAFEEIMKYSISSCNLLVVTMVFQSSILHFTFIVKVDLVL